MRPFLRRSLRFFLGFLAACLITIFVTFTQYALWEWANRGEPMLEVSSDQVNGFAYSAYRRGQTPLQGIFPSETELAGDIDLLANHTRRLRTYSSLENSAVVALAGFRDMEVTNGIWLDQSEEGRNEREIAAGIALAQKYGNITRSIVGNETLHFGRMRLPDLIVALKKVRQATGKPVSSAEPLYIWERNPELAQNVDFITVHLFPYHEGVPVESAVGFTLMRVSELRRKYPGKKIVIGETGWPSRGAVIGAAVPSLANEARFIRGFLAAKDTAQLDYFLMEAFDQPWKVKTEGWAGQYWGVFDVDRVQKFSLEGSVAPDQRWHTKALFASGCAALPIFLMMFALSGWSFAGRLWLAILVQSCVTALVLGINISTDYYLTGRDLIALTALVIATLVTISVLLTHGYEFGEILFKRRWERRFTPLPPLPPGKEPFVSIHLACYNEPPEMVIETIESLARMRYRNFEVLVIDNNTADPALWKPVEAHMAKMDANFRFFHLRPWPGFKAGALNFALKETDPRAEVVGVVDADYVVDPDWLSCLVPHFVCAPDVAVVQAPQAHRNWERQPFSRMCNWEFEGFFRIGMHHRNERNALIQHGTMTLVRRRALDEAGGWSEWCICEDSELGLRLLRRGYDTRYVDVILGRGLTPADFAAIKSQRFRWAFGAMQILKAHLPALLGFSRLSLAQRYHFLTGWFSWFGDALQLVFVFASLGWSLLMLLAPASFNLPVASLIAPMLGFMAFKAALGPILYRHAMRCPWRDIAGASLLSAGLSHAIARGVFAGLVRRKGSFVVTPKGWKKKGGWAFVSAIREELGLLIGLLLCAWLIAGRMNPREIATQAWIAVLLLETIPYWAALGSQLAAYWRTAIVLRTRSSAEHAPCEPDSHPCGR
ncbi:MAG: glycosyltransferase [Zoogloeaceae bacterium]|jgi:cellulose synthase/poly-beta-1,6-N-acetylglucosamine synthase-like glycosyltransferase/exo-beta-1,3-glucanase (GH17 family)|nr:glycosyltransferase [Zoogloeaceae bacterium]